jgi:hypothetical protein
MACRLLRCDRPNRHAELPSHHCGYVAEGNPFLGNGMIARAGGAALQRKAIETRGVVTVNRRPAILASLYVSRDAPLPGSVDEHRHETVVAFPVDGWWKPDDGNTDALRHEGQRERLGGAADAGMTSVAGSYSSVPSLPAKPVAPVRKHAWLSFLLGRWQGERAAFHRPKKTGRSTGMATKGWRNPSTTILSQADGRLINRYSAGPGGGVLRPGQSGHEGKTYAARLHRR